MSLNVSNVQSTLYCVPMFEKFDNVPLNEDVLDIG